MVLNPFRFRQALAVKLAWLISLRWIAIVLQSVAGALAFQWVLLYHDLAWPFAGILAFLALFNLYSWQRLRSGVPLRESFIGWQLSVDTLALTGLLVLSGGIRNPFCVLLFIHAGLGALLLKGREARVFLGVLVLSLASVYGLRNVQILSGDIYLTDTLPLVSISLALLVVWALVAGLSHALAQSQTRVFQLKEQRQRLDHLRALGAMTAELTHQLATPLNTIKLRASRLARQAPGASGDAEGLLQAVERCEEALRRMVAAPVDVSALALQETSMSVLVASVVDGWGTTHPTSSVRFRGQSEGICRVPPVLLSDSLRHLLDNARENAGDKPVEVTVSRVNGSVAITVEDRGPGFSPDVKARLGQPFLTTRPEGTGLGLYNCITLCEALQGSLSVADRAGGGAVVKIELPVVGKGAGA